MSNVDDIFKCQLNKNEFMEAAKLQNNETVSNLLKKSYSNRDNLFYYNFYVYDIFLRKAFIRPVNNQPFDCTTFVLEVLSVHGNELRLFWFKAIPLL